MSSHDATNSAYAQVPQQDPHDALPLDISRGKMVSHRALMRAYWLTAVLCCGGALFGYDSGVIGGVLTFDSFQNSFDFGHEDKTRVSSIAVGIQQAGALVGCFLIWPLTNRGGRRVAMMACSLVFCIGVILEVLNLHSMSIFYAGRAICGLGVGGSSTVIPIYLSEMSPKEIRGQLGSCYQFTFTIGILISYWIDYAVKFMVPSPSQWQIPIGIQMVPGALMGIGMLTLDESVRWLIFRGDDDRAWKSLVWVRGSDSPDTEAEFAEMKHGVEEARHATAGFKIQELLEWPNAHRLLLAFGLFSAQQSTGATAMAYFGPQFFSLLVGPGDKTLLLTGVFGAIKVISCGLFVVFVSERFGRRTLLIFGATLQSACMIATAAVVKDRPPPGDGVITGAGIATVALIYLDVSIYNFSWGGLPWPLVSEMFPTRIREPGVAFGVASQWLFNFVWSFSTPYIMDAISWGTFLLFGLLDAVIVVFVYLFVKETAGKTLEEINAMFEPAGPHNDQGWKLASQQDEEDQTHKNIRTSQIEADAGRAE